MAEACLVTTAVVLLVLRLGQAEAEEPAVGIDLMAAEARKLVDRRLRDALAELAWRLRSGGVASGLHGFPERRRGTVGLRQRRMRGQADRRNNGADRGTHNPSLAGERHADVAPGADPARFDRAGS
jgi:hypothetical protein